MARKKAEEAARAAYRPKEYSNDEKAEWAAKKADLEQFFSSICMKQSNDYKEPEAPADGEGEEEKKDEKSAPPSEKASEAGDGEEAKDGDAQEHKIVYGQRMIRE